MPAVSGGSTRLDATTQTVNIGNTNGGTLGTGGTVGVDAISLPTFPRPEVQLTAGNTVVVLSGNNSAVLGLALRQGYLQLTGTGCLARNNLVGMTATGSSADNSPTTYGIEFAGSNSTVRNNFVTVNNSGIRTQSGGTGSLVTLNEVARPTSGHTDTFDGILLVGTVSSIQVTANLTLEQRGGGIEVGFGGGVSASNITVTNNTVRNNGFATGGSGASSTEPIGMAAYAYAGSNVVFSRNLIRDNAGAGILVMTANGTTISQNSFSNNGGLSIDLDPRNIDPNGLGAPQGVTINDNNDSDAGPNLLRNFPVIVQASLVGTELSLGGFARPGSAIELYIAQADPTGFGEGLTYLGVLTEGSPADLDATTGTYGPANINGVAQGTDNTNRFSFRHHRAWRRRHRHAADRHRDDLRRDFGVRRQCRGHRRTHAARGEDRGADVRSLQWRHQSEEHSRLRAVVQRARHQPGQWSRRQQRRRHRGFRAGQHAIVRGEPGRRRLRARLPSSTGRRAAL